jgi:hypothetical protein
VFFAEGDELGLCPYRHEDSPTVLKVQARVKRATGVLRAKTVELQVINSAVKVVFEFFQSPNNVVQTLMVDPDLDGK